ncbi:MAG: Zn-ribbon domain-containing OB-fold protein [Syntrophales bacterium]|nr:Zn-ribbon domain-containing OB-fold protein [Syntrophales bacterium]MDD5533165.1 Zn-ribbon domain-containing OB-fold protein [Syntrophales bacterium]
MTKDKKNPNELLYITSGEMYQPYRYTLSSLSGRFLTEIKEKKKFLGVKCPECGRVYVPPRAVCGRCYARMNEMVQVSDEGEVVACAIVEFGFVDPSTGIERPVPYGTAFIRLDGADTALSHFLDCVDREKLKVGARVRAVFEEERTGSIMDIKHFEVID